MPLNKLGKIIAKLEIDDIYAHAVKFPFYRLPYDSISSYVKIGSTISRKFNVTKGLRQLLPQSSGLRNMGICIGDDKLFTVRQHLDDYG